jgi:hypothetical protein
VPNNEKLDINKRGPLTRDDKKFIADNHEKLSLQEMAITLRRNPKTIESFIQEHYGSHFQERAKVAEYDIQNTPIWKDLIDQFTERELDMFLYHWGRIVSQFRDDVYPTEQMQVVDCVKLEILMNRALNHQNECINEIAILESLLRDEKAVDADQQNKRTINSLEQQIRTLRASQESHNDDYRNMLKEKGSILKEMKATRDARIKFIESGKYSFVGWMRNLLENPERRLALGREMEKNRLAMQAEYERLSDYHEFEDGVVDQPLLTPERVLDDR